jgi:hypothetical protein
MPLHFHKRCSKTRDVYCLEISVSLILNFPKSDVRSRFILNKLSAATDETGKQDL